MKAIGGYLELEELDGQEYYQNLIAINYGRNAVLALLQSKASKEVWMPAYFCDSIEKVCIENEIQVKKYHITEEMKPVLDNRISAKDNIIIVNYFGSLSVNDINQYHDKYENMILDNAQAFYAQPLPHIDTVYTCRKFFGVPDGAYLACERFSLRLNESRVLKQQMEYLIGRYQEEAENHYYEYVSMENKIKEIPIQAMSRLTHNLLRAIDYNGIAQRRKSNYNQLHSVLGKSNLLKLECHTIPFSYPYIPIHKNSEQLRNRLRKEKIYVPMLWPNVIKDLIANEMEKGLAEYILPLPCDQRYGKVEMQKIIEIIQEFGE